LISQLGYGNPSKFKISGKTGAETYFPITSLTGPTGRFALNLAYRHRQRWFELGRIATHSAIAEARRAATHAKHVKALRKWNPSDLPQWLDEDFYRREILPSLSKFTVKVIRKAIEVSHPYATLIRSGDRVPHPRHWLTLARLAGIKH